MEVTLESLRTGVASALRSTGKIDDAMDRIQDMLHGMSVAGQFSFPPSFSIPHRDHYARRLLYSDFTNGTSAVLMTWGPGQATPIHDHAGTWCVECVVAGTMEVRRFDLVEQNGDLCRFESGGTVIAAEGSTGALIPPFEYHVLGNLSPQTSLTLHIYGGSMDECHIYTPDENGWHVKRSQRLAFSADTGRQ